MRDPRLTGAIAPGARERAEQLASALPPLLVAAERVATTVAQGVHGRRRVGQGETFWQFRHYVPGEDVRRVDWRQSAKSQHVYIRETEWEAAQSVWMWRDASPSMRWRSHRNLPEKVDRADLLLVALAALLVRAGERVAMLGEGLRPQTGKLALDTICSLLAEATRGAASLPEHEPLPRYATLVMIGDFLDPLPDIAALVGRFGGSGVRGHLLQVIDPAELAFPFRGRVRFEGTEGEEPELLSRADGVREAYGDRIAAQTRGLAEIARASGWTWALHRTDQPPQTALLALYAALAGPTALGFRGR